jgi:hypothetical protein
MVACLPEQAGGFIAGPIETTPQYVRRHYSHGTAKISVTIAPPGSTPMSYDEWVKMSSDSPLVALNLPVGTGLGFYDCSGTSTKGFCNVHIHLRKGFHIELMGEGTAHRTDFDALLSGLQLRSLVN